MGGHVHNYQRFTQKLEDGRQIPHLVAGDGGYADSVAAMHKLQRDPSKNNAPITAPFATDMAGVTLESYNEIAGGFGRVTVDDQNLTFEYFACPLTGATPTKAFDSFTLNWKTQKITASNRALGSIPKPRRRPFPSVVAPERCRRLGRQPGRNGIVGPERFEFGVIRPPVTGGDYSAATAGVVCPACRSISRRMRTACELSSSATSAAVTNSPAATLRTSLT